MNARERGEREREREREGGEEKFNQIYHARAYSPFMRIK